MLPDDLVERGEGGLDAGLEPVCPGGDHDVLEEHPVIEPTADFEPSVDREDQADRGIEENQVAGVLVLHALGIPARDPEKAVEAEPDRPPPRQVGFEEAIRIVAVFGVQGGGIARRMALNQRLREAALHLPGKDIGAPGLHVRAARGTCSDVENALDDVTRNWVRLERPNAAAADDRRLDGVPCLVQSVTPAATCARFRRFRVSD